jgi:ubiquinone/menaquinone biosynthesis C-methylase UbiE
MARLTAVAAFDRIAPVYDATRAPIDAATLDAIAGRLRELGVRTLLEVGVGTGRVAVPLTARGFRITGLDASAPMLGRARAKGVERLVRGSAYSLPFRDRGVDLALFVHVLHILDDPRSALREACRVGPSGAAALLNAPAPDDADRVEQELRENPRRLVAEILARRGYPGPATMSRAGPRLAEARLLEAVPPDHLEIVADRTATERLSTRLETIALRGARQFLDVPPDALDRAVAEARAELGERTSTVRHVEAFAVWSRPPPGGSTD